MSSRVRARFASEAEEMRRVEFLHHKWMMGFDAVKGLIEDGGLAAVVAIGIYEVASGDMTPGTVLALAMLYKSAAIPLQNLHRIVDELHESVLQIDAAGDVMGADRDPSLAGSTRPEMSDRLPCISLRGLSLRRHDADGRERRTLDGVDLDISFGEVVGIAGPSGGGKTTLLRAILGLLPAYEGQLRILGAEVRDLSKADLADLVGYGPQRPYVRAGTVRDNIIEAVTREGEISDAEIQHALRRAQLDLEPDKWLSERGDNISPGQAQRLSLARIFAKQRARIVVLDEATSMLDGTTQAVVMQELRQHAAGRALLMVAHRLDTLKWADRILVLDQGRVAQCGTFDQLSKVPGTFAQLLGRQESVAGEKVDSSSKTSTTWGDAAAA
jgi:ATP-binding cassette subfamily B protein